MALAAADLYQPSGRLAPDLVPRTPDEVAAYAEDGSGYATDTAKTAAYVEAYRAEGYADARVTALTADALQDAAVRLFVYWRTYETRADALALLPASGSADGEGSYRYDLAQISAARSLADGFEADFLSAVADDPPADAPRKSTTSAKAVLW